MLLCFGLRLSKFPGIGFQSLVSHEKGFRARLRLECISYRKAGLIRCYHHPHPPQAVPPLPEGEGSLMWRITSLVEGEGSLRTIPPHTLGKGTFLEDGFCDFAFGSAQNDRNGRHIVKSESIRTGETEHKGVWCYAHWLLIQSTLVVDALCIAWRCSANWYWCCSQKLLWLRALVVDWCHQHWFLIDSYDKYWAGADTFVPFVAAYFNELVSSSALTPTLCHSARRVYPELQNPLFQKSQGKPSPSREKVPEGRMRGKGEPTRNPFSLPQHPHSNHFDGKSWSLSL